MAARTERQFYTIREASEVLGLHYNTVWRLIQQKEIPAVKIGKTWHIPTKYFEDLQEKGTNNMSNKKGLPETAPEQQSPLNIILSQRRFLEC